LWKERGGGWQIVAIQKFILKGVHTKGVHTEIVMKEKMFELLPLG